jgi:excisionase family DNA binding protein
MSEITTGDLKTERLLLRVEEAAEVMGLSRAKVYELLTEGRIPSIKLGRSRRIPVSALKGWIEAELATQSMNP